ncbi:helix-turn-helix transcriptional regulator [Mesorhizobium loti]|uniref:Helix-turn-helix transcriptional regulator n=1 Tax=Rhizobium loti TaxID=381 RepID=A0A101KRS0_RHILI|nr:helix-turn-helix transcriptional regulator [Mesorhizobium loti]
MSDLDQGHPKTRAAEVDGELKQGREAYAKRAWADAYHWLSRVDQAEPLSVDDLERLATSTFLIGREDEYLAMLERIHHAHLNAGDGPRAARYAFWLGLRLLLRGEKGAGTSWLTRAQRLLEREGHDCVEQGYLLLPAVLQHIDAADWRPAYAAATRAAEIGERFEEADLSAAARHLQGRILMLQGQVEKGLALVDEAMVAVAAGELSPILTGLIYCYAIDGCQQVYALGRAREWTAALAKWCDEQSGLVFTGRCLVHRAEIMQLRGDWADAIDEARHATERLCQGTDRQVAAAALYQEAEIHRLRGEFAAAEEKYRGASLWGWEPQPGLALLRLAQGQVNTAAAAIRRVVNATAGELQRTRLLPAYVEIMLAAGDVRAARDVSCELDKVASRFDAGVLGAIADHACGAVALAEGDARAALGPLRRAFEVWQQVEAPYLAAQVRMQIGLACRALGDEDGAGLELGAARIVFEELGAAPDLARIDSFAEFASQPDRPHGLTRRELQVLRLVAAGKTNKAIATELFVSEKTVDRHVSNIFGKLDVSSRAAATAYAYKQGLIPPT